MDAGTQSSDTRLAWLALALTPGLSARRAFELVDRFGTPAALLAASPPRLRDAGVEDGVAQALSGAIERGRREAAALGRLGATLVAWGDPAYPEGLREIPEPPLTLAVRGTLAVDEPAVAVVGTRRASEYGRRIAADLAAGLARAGLVVVSGLASGIDAAAHRAALAASGRTVAVLGTGIDVVYPRWHAELTEAIAGSGALVSEFPCGTAPLAHHFPRRNRIISGLSLGAIVVEAAEQSGSLITAAYAVEQNRQVYAVPGPLGSARQHGPHRLIQQGAKLVTRVEDVIEDLAPQLLPRLAARRAADVSGSVTVAERRMLEVLGDDGRHLDELIGALGVPAGAVLETLLALELRGFVRQLPGKRFSRLAA
jgi:DNA processing protein